MKKIVLIFLIIFGFNIARSQVIINPQLPPFGLMLKSQLWNLTLINADNEIWQVQIQILVTDVSNNQKIFTGTSKVITLQKGQSEISPIDAAPITYNILNNSYNLDTSPDGFLPLGVFDVCYTIILTKGGSKALAEQCENIEVMPLSPPTLISPADNDTLQIFNPSFIWLPPQPFNLFTGLAYKYNLVAVQPMQTGAEAIQQNFPIEEQQGLIATDLLYNASLPALDTGVLYAWQITATNNGTPISKSDVWTFRIKQSDTSLSSKQSKNYFARLKRNIDASYGICEGVLKYAYQNEINDTTVNFFLYDITSSARKQLHLDSSYVKVTYGQNYNSLDFSEENILSAGHMYLLELINSRNEHWYLKFEYLKSN